MARARGEDETVRSGDVGHSSAQTLAAGAAPSPTTPALPVVPVENYVRIDEYARGGLGRIIRAKDERTGRYVAIKEMLADDADAATRFVREAVVTANLQHPAIVPVYEVGQWPDGQPFYAMKLVRGRALNEVIAATEDLDGRLALVSHVAAVADALAYAHGERVIHRDLKPHNVLCGAFGETVVIDWGLARRLDETEGPPALHGSSSAALGETHAGAVMGTPSYMSPEQARGERADQQSDVYAIGAILYHLLAGRPPHIARDVDTLLQRVRDATPEALPAEVPRDLAAIVEQAMARDREKRYPSAAELASDLRRFMTGQLVLAHHYTRRQRLARFVSRYRGAVAVAGVALAIVGGVATFAIRGILTARGEAAASRDEARARLVTSYVDRAGLELVNGQPARSLAYTIASAQVAGLTPQTRLMAAHALDQLPPMRWRSESKVGYAMFAPGSHDLLLSIDDIVRWNPDTDRVVWSVPRGVHGDVKLVRRDTLAFSREGAIALVKVADGEPIGELQGSSGARYYGPLGMDEGARWLAAKSDRWIDLFDTTTRALVASIPFANGSLSQVAADGEHVMVVAIAPAVLVLDRTGKVVATFEAELGNVVAAGDELVYASPPDKSGILHLVVGDWSGHVRLDLPIGATPFHALAVDVAAKRIALGTEDGVVQVRSLASGDASWQTTLGDRISGVVFDGNVLRALSSNAAVSFNVTSGLELERASLAGGNILAASDDHARVAVVAYGAGFAVWAPARSEFMPIASNAAKVPDVVFAPDGSAITTDDDAGTLARLDDGTLIAAGTDGTIVVRARDGRELRRFATGAAARPSPDGRQIAAATFVGTVAIWDTATGTSTRTLGKLAPVSSIRWSPDGRRVAAVTKLGAVSVWDVGGSVLREIAAGNFFGNVAFSNDGHWLARAGEPADRLFALDGGSDRKLLDARPNAALVVAFSPDDRTVLVAGMGFLWTWDVATAAPRLRIAAGGWITSAAFLGNYIIAGGSDRRIHVWNADSGAELLAFTVPAQPRKLLVDRSGARVAILAGRGAIVWKVPAFSGTLEDLRERAKCRVDVEVVDAQLRAHPIDIAACNRVATEPPR